MEKYLLNLLPRLRAFGKRLNKIEEFADKTWVLRDLSGAVITYRFKRSGVLRKTINGDIQDLRWELEGTDAISITDPVSRRGEMFRHGFVLDGLLVVQKEGIQTTPFIFYNEAVVTDGDVNSYLFDTFVRKERLKKVNAARGYYFKQDEAEEPITVGATVYDDQLRVVENDVINLSDRSVFIKNGKIVSINYYKTLWTDKGQIRVTSNNYAIISGGVSTGDKIEIGSNSLFSGTLKLKNSSTRITVKGGVITDVSYFGNTIKISLALALVFLTILLFYYVNKTNETDNNQVGNTANLLDTTKILQNDDSAALTDSNANLSLEIPQEYQPRLNNNVRNYFKAINERSWPELFSLFANHVSYLGTTLEKDKVIQNLKNYWGNMSNECRVIHDDKDIFFSVNNNLITGQIEVIDYAEKGFYKIPYLYRANMTFEFNRNYEIVSISSSISESKPFFAKLFNLSMEIIDEDYRLRNRASDWDNIFTTLQKVVYTNPSVYDEYTSSVINIYGQNCYVEVTGMKYTLSEYMEMIKTGSINAKSVSMVKGDQYGKTIIISTY